MLVRIQKYLSEQGILSRREAEAFIKKGLISVNGKKVTVLGTKIDPLRDKVSILKDGDKLRGEKITIAYYKPRGVVSSRNTNEGETIYQLLPQFAHLHIVGRLDKESEGLILLTNDGVLAHVLTGKEHLIPKEYEVTVQEKIEPLHMRLMVNGVVLEDGLAKAVKAEVLGSYTFRLVLKEGRKHQIRRMCDAVRLTTTRLKRVKIGGLDLRGLKSGGFRKLSPKEVESLKSARFARRRQSL
ncbi:MAG: pseudouridine synthase [bacterium]|nr:pseudouridine synthase [bacterium]